MSGYLYYKPTGVKEVDMIASALETAGSGYHHTSQWSEKDDDNKSNNDYIQEALDKCAEKMKKLEQRTTAKARH